MFVGFDSQNTSHSFLHYPNWNLWVWEIPLIGFRGWSVKIFPYSPFENLSIHSTNSTELNTAKPPAL